MQTFPLTDNTGYNGHFTCPDTEPKYESSLMSTDNYYQKHFLSPDGHLVASYPDMEGGEVVHEFDKNQFCLAYLQVFIKKV